MEFNGIMTKQEGVAVRAVDKHGPLNGSPTKDFSHDGESFSVWESGTWENTSRSNGSDHFHSYVYSIPKRDMDPMDHSVQWSRSDGM